MFTIVNNKNIEKRRKLRNENLELILQSREALLEDFVELETKFIGKIQQISYFYDIKIKKNLFKIIDDEQNKSQLPTVLSNINDAILRVNAYIVEILTRDTEEMIAAFPLHNISNVCYANKNNENLISIQYGNTFESNEYYNLYLLHTNNKKEAETICSLFKQCFQLLHIERTMSLLDQVIRDETISNYSINSHANDLNENNITFEATPNLLRKNMNSKNSDDTKSIGCSTIHDQIQQPEVNKIDALAAAKAKIDAHQTIESFINKLKKELNKKEFECFAIELAEWQKGKPFDEFCKEALKIFGIERKYLIIDMRPFVPIKKLDWYESFLKETINNDKKVKRTDSISSNDSSSSLVADNAKNLNRSTRTLQNSDHSNN